MKQKIIGLAIAMLMVALAVIPVMAQPPVLPCTWSGNVTFDGSPVANGTLIRAKVGAAVVGETTTSGAAYMMLVPQVGGVPAEGATVSFYIVIGGTEYLGGSDTWNTGGFKVLNLAAVSGPRYTLTVTVSPAAKGSVSLSPTQPAAGYDAGTVVTLTATPTAGWRFSHWSGDASGTSATVTVTMNANKSVTANFIAVYTLTVTVSPAAKGSVSLSPTQPAVGYDAGTVVTLTATPTAGWRFSHWSGDATGTSASVSVTMTAPRSVTANFVEYVPAKNFAWWLYETFVAPLRD